MIDVSLVNVPNASLGARPATRIAGCIALPETLYPTAMLPALSCAMLPIQRKFESGPYVPCWNTAGVAPGVLVRSSYQRIPEPVALWRATAVDTEWFTTHE